MKTAESALDAAETESEEEVALAVKKRMGAGKSRQQMPPVSRESSGAAARAVDSEHEPSSSSAAHGGGLSSTTGHKSNAPPRVSPRKRTQPSKLDAGGDLVRKSRRSHPRKNYNEDEVAEADFDDVINEEDESDNSGSSERENRR